VKIPSYRFDIDGEGAVVAEVARIYGYDEIPEITATGSTPLATAPEDKIDVDRAAATLVARDYQEVVTYSFVDKKLDSLITGRDSKLELSNPISSEMSVMRGSIWPGLIQAAAANVARQQDRIRFFEIGKTFHGDLEAPVEIVRLSAIVVGDVVEKQWAYCAQAVDFFDIKSEVEVLLKMTGAIGEFSFRATEHAALQTGQAARIFRNEEEVGVIGKLIPTVARRFELDREAFLFELNAGKCFASSVPVAKAISRFPSVRRDIAVIVRDNVKSADLVAAVESAAPALVRNVRIFDVYKGPGIEAGLKSIALGLILQETSRTLTDEDADAVMAAVLRKMQADFGAELRD